MTTTPNATRGDIRARLTQIDRSLGHLTQSVNRGNIRISELRREKLDLERRLEQFLPKPPDTYGPKPVFITFSKKWPSTGDKLYNYAAIGHGGKWAITQTSRADEVLPPLSWRELLDFIGEDQWGSISRLIHLPMISLSTVESPRRWRPVDSYDITVQDRSGYFG